MGKKNEAFAELQRLVQYNLHPLVLQHFGPNAHPGVAGPLPAEVVSGAVAGSTGVAKDFPGVFPTHFVKLAHVHNMV